MITQDKLIALKLSSELYEKLVAEANKQNRTISSMVRVMIIKYLNYESNKK